MSSRFNHKNQIEYFSLILGLIFLILGLIGLFKFPDSFFGAFQSGKGRLGGVPLPVITIVGWIMFSYGVISAFKWTENNRIVRIASSFPKVKKWKLNNKVFFGLTVIFLNFILLIYFLIRI